MKQYCFGIDIGGTTVKCGLFSTAGEVLDKWEIKSRIENNGAAIIPDVAETINAKIAEKNLNKEEIAGIGIGVPGPVNDKGEVLVAVNLHWGKMDVEGDLSRMTGLKVKAGNDANVAALGELWKGGGAGYHNMILVTLGTGVGGGIIINDQVIAGTNGAGGEIGHAHVDDDLTDICNCGNSGCLEQFVSATGIVRMAKEALAATSAPSMLREGEVSAKSVFDAVKANDPVAIQVAERFGMILGKALAAFAVVCDPQIIVIGGGVSKAGTILLDYVIEPFKKYTFKECRNAEFALAKLGNDAGIFGAAKLVL